MSSLRGRLFVGLTTGVLLTGLTAGGVAFRWAFDEAIELQDALLLQIGSLAVGGRLPPPGTTARGIDAEAQVMIEEPGAADGESGAQMPALPAGLPDGLQTVSRGGGQWRVLMLTRPTGGKVAVSQPTAYRDELARDSALHSILPLAALIPCLLLLVGAILGRTFRPVFRLAGELNAKRSDHLAKLPLDGMPDELRPFVTSINNLLERIAALFDRQRRFVADAAHELRTPITALSLHAENLGQVELPAEARDRLATLNGGIRRTARLLDQLLALARYESRDVMAAAPTRFDLVVRDVVADLMPLAQHRRIDLGFVRIDAVALPSSPVALAAVVRNLLDNALRYTPPGGRIDIDLHREADRIAFTIEDTGPGIPPADFDKMFEPFVRGEQREGEGSGLGLSIVRHIVDRLGGVIILQNVGTVDRSGLRVTVSLRPNEPT